MKGNAADKIIRVGSRKSELALIQTKHVIGRLQKLFPNKKFEIHTMTTIGDRILNISLPKIGEKSLFTRDLEDALRNGSVDFVVHSLKDLPTILPEGMAIGAVLEREDARDALVLKREFDGFTLNTLPRGSVIGTSSLRRTAQLRRQYPDLEVCDIRGNLNTRLAKLDAKESKFTGIVLAQAGLVRMGWTERINQILEPPNLLYAVGQGALAVECRENDDDILEMLRNLMCLNTTCRILAERSFLKTLGGGCSAPVAVCSKLKEESCENTTKDEFNLHLDGAVWSLDGTVEIREKLACSLDLMNKVVKVSDTPLKEDIGNGDEPLRKKVRLDVAESEQGASTSPPIINDDANIELLSNKNIKELVNKHMNIMKRDTPDNAVPHKGGGDGPTTCTTLKDLVHSDIGTDVMGECPVVGKETKISMENYGKCPIKTGSDSIDWTIIPSSSSTTKCPFTALLKESNESNTINKPTDVAKCPYVQEIVNRTTTRSDNTVPRNETLLCGLYRHACFSRELYEKSNQLGQKLAEELIKKGALDVMKKAQAEIHSKA